MKLIHIKEPKHSKEILERLARKIIEIKPDIILFELPQPKIKENSLSFFNKFNPKNKPKERINEIKQNFLYYSKKYPWLKSFPKVIEAIEKLWKEGKQVYLYEIDAPIELTAAGEGTNGLINLVWNYLREEFMVKNIRKIAKKHKGKIALIICHDFHWKNILFLLKNKDKKKIKEFYFKNKTNLLKNIEKELAKNKILLKYWKKFRL